MEDEEKEVQAELEAFLRFIPERSRTVYCRLCKRNASAATRVQDDSALCWLRIKLAILALAPFCQGRAPRLPSYDPFGFGAPVYSLVPEPALEDTVQLARARYLHALEEQQAAREAYAAHHLRAFQDEAAISLQQQQRRRRQIAIEEARLQAQRARREQFIHARREEELRRRRQELEEHEFSQALMLAFELASQVEPRHVEHAPAHPACACGHTHVHRTVRHSPVGPAPSRPVPGFQTRVRFSPQALSARVPVASPSKPAATPVTLNSALKPTSPAAPIRIGIREMKAESSSSAVAPTPPQPAAAAAPVCIPIRESKGKASSQVRINVVSTPVSQSLAPADAIAALSLLEADLDALNPATSVPLLRHQLNGILESVDAIESGGHDAVREVRRALVRRIEEALVAVERGDAIPTAPRRSAGITINEPAASRVEVKAVPQPAPSAVSVHSDATAAPMPVASEQDILDDVDVAPEPQEPATPSAMTDAAPVVEGYVVDDFLEPTPVAPSSPPPSSTPAHPGVLSVQDHAEQAPAAELATTFEEDQGITSAGAEPIATTDEGSVAMNEDKPVATTALANDDSISVEAASSGVDIDSVPTSPTSAAGSASLPAAVPDLPTTVADPTSPAAVAAEPTSPVVADPDGIASLTPNETPLTASYPPAQTFAAPTHPAVDAGSDGEWERPGSSGSEGEKSDYEVV